MDTGLSTIEDLPDEVLWLILQMVRRRDVKSMSLVSRKYNDLAAPVLFRKLVLRRSLRFVKRAITPYFSNGIPQKKLHHVREVTFLVPFDHSRLLRCPHATGPLTPFASLRDAAVDVHKVMREDVQWLFTKLQMDRLTSFSWHCGTCVPEGVVDTHGRGFRKGGSESEFPYRPPLKRLSLITDAWCSWQHPSSYFEHDFSWCTGLEHLSWFDIFGKQELQHLSIILRNNAETLASLKISINFWPHAQRFRARMAQPPLPSGHLFFSEVLGIAAGSSRVLFPALRVLWLEGLELFERSRKQAASNELITAFNGPNLHSLTLRSCRGAWAVCGSLSQIIQGRKAACHHLEISDLMLRPADVDTQLFDGSPFSGLEDLFVQFRTAHDAQPADSVRLDPHFTRNCFKRLVLDYRKGDSSHNLNYVETSSRLMFGLNVCRNAYISRLIERAPLICLGISIDVASLGELAASLFRISKHPSIKLLHLRTPKLTGAYNKNKFWNSSSLFDWPADIRWFLQTQGLSEDAYNICKVFNISLVWSVPNVTLDFQKILHWMFFEESFPALQVVAFGDFSHAHLRKPEGALFCKNERSMPWECLDEDLSRRPSVFPNFRTVMPCDYGHLGLIEDHMDFLSACPYTKIKRPVSGYGPGTTQFDFSLDY